MKPVAVLLLLITLIVSNPSSLFAQEESLTSVRCNYLAEKKTKSLTTFNARVCRLQSRTLKKLRKKERRFEARLKRNDSSAFAKYKLQNLSYDSISRIKKTDTGTLGRKLSQSENLQIDSVKAIKSFANSAKGNGDKQLDSLKGELNFRKHINEQINKRTNSLKSFASKEKHAPSIKGMEKSVFYSKAKMNAFKEIAEEPSKGEEKALEYLKGTKGFSEHMANACDKDGQYMRELAGSGADASKLEELGLATNRMTAQNLHQNFGEGVTGITSQMGKDLGKWQKQQNAMTNAKHAKKSVSKIKGVRKPSFKVNPMRGLPFRQRLEKEYNWQTSIANRATGKPALLDVSAMVGFKHTPKLTYGVGVTGSLGMGESLKKIKPSFEGVGGKVYAKWEMLYGIGAYASFERIYSRPFLTGANTNETEEWSTTHNNRNYRESIMIGLSKSYKINEKYTGAIQVLFDVWWQQKGLRSPIVLRFATTK